MSNVFASNHPLVAHKLSRLRARNTEPNKFRALARELAAAKLRVSRIASGVPHGGDLEFADQITLGRAIDGRRSMGS